jgi:hypothetical protein
MPIVPFPRAVLQSANWQQEGGRPQVQRSAFTGRTTELADFGPAARWSADCGPIPMKSGTEAAHAFAGFEAACQVPGNSFRLPLSAASQHGPAANFVQNPDLASGTAPWITGSGFTRVAAATSTQLPSPVDWAFLTTSASTGLFLHANNDVRSPIAAAARLFLSAWTVHTAGATGDLSLFVFFHDAGGTFISSAAFQIGPGTGTAGAWRRMAGFVVAPAGSASVLITVSNSLTLGSQWIGSYRAGLLPDQATVSGSSNAGRSLALAGLALSQRNLRAGQFITVTLPGSDEQLIRLAADLVADGSGNATASLATPLRATPAANAIVWMDNPHALMRATHTPGFSQSPGGILGQSLSCEEAF